jgi:subtilisin-like proprotein convertase family protein/subtilisin family serine protease
LLILIVFTQNNFAQSIEQRKKITADYNIEQLKTLSQFFSDYYKTEKRKAIKYAQENNIPIVIPEKNGGVSILQRVLDDGTLIYTTTYNAGAAITINTNQVYAGGIKGLSLDGSGINFGMWDGGAVRDSHQELVGRVVQIDNPSSLSSHATHVSGTMIASGVNPSAKGMSFAANLTAYDFDNDLSEMTNEAANGMLVSNHSYGINPASIPETLFGAYISSTADIDQLVFNAPNYLPVFAAGNSRNVPPSQGGPYNPSKNGFDLISGKNLAKNILSVANVLEVNNYVDASSVVMSSTSSWGPTDDGRIKPDISAKGTNTFSCVANTDSSYAFFSGTSMATPSVSGSLGLLHQHYNNVYGSFLNAASMKAIVLHTAREAGDAPGPDYKFGWGLMDTGASADVITNKNFTSIIEENTLNQGDTYTKTVDAVGINQPLVATIAWTDPAGTVSDLLVVDSTIPKLVNDLDIKITAPDGSTQYFPWTLDVASPDSPATTGNNIVDNVEKIEIDDAIGQYTIEISHKGTLQNLSQDYSLIVTGIAESQFAIQTDSPNLTFCADQTAIFDLDVNSISSFTGNINLIVSGLPSSLSASLSPSTINNEGTSTLSIDNLASVSPGDYPFSVTAYSGIETFSFDLNLTIESATSLPNLTINSPNNNQLSVLSPVLDWNSIPEANTYEVQLSSTSNFDSLLFSMITQDSQVEAPELEANQTYFWRVNPINNCVTGNFATSSFTTKTLECLPLTTSTDTPVTIISSGPNSVQSVVNISGVSPTKFIEDVNVTFELTHTWLADIEVTLTSPDGTTITLLDQPCDDLDDVDVIFDDKGLAQTCNDLLPPALIGSIKAEEKLSSFVGENINGDWILTVNDMFSGDGGSIDSFGVELCYEETLSVDDNVISDFKIFPNPSQGQVNISLNQSLNQDLNLEVFDLNGRSLKTFEVNPSVNQFRIDLSDLSSGIYFVSLKTQNSKAVKKLILK